MHTELDPAWTAVALDVDRQQVEEESSKAFCGFRHPGVPGTVPVTASNRRARSDLSAGEAFIYGCRRRRHLQRDPNGHHCRV